MNGIKYSDWFKIDLHIHTDKSRETKENDYKGDFLVDVLKNKLIENKVEIFSLTDHNIINIEAYTKYYNDYNEGSDPLLLAGVELDIQGTDSKSYHSLLIFNYSDISSVKKLSDKLENKYLDKGISDKKKRILTFPDIVDVFEKDDFFFIPHAGNTKSIVKSNRNSIPETQRMLILMQSALEKVTKEETTRIYNEGFDELFSDDFKNKNDIAYINFSDNHNCHKYPCVNKGENDGQEDHAFYYIKGTKSYESIRLAFIDPESRIMSANNYNRINKTINTIDKINIPETSMSHCKILNTELTFSPHFNAIIGGRSSGKSLLMYLLGDKIDGLKIEKNNYEIGESLITIKTKNDAVSKDKISLDSNSYIYLRQGDIVRYFEDNKLNELAKKSGKEEDYNDIKQEIIKRKDELSSKVNELQRAYKDSYDNYSSNIFILQENIINNALNGNYIIKFNNENISRSFCSTQYTSYKELIKKEIDNLNEIIGFDLLAFNEDEISQIRSVISILNHKIIDIRKILQKIEIKEKFIDFVIHIVEATNNTLSDGAVQKTNALSEIGKLKTKIKNKFISMKHLKDVSYAVESFECSMKKSFEIEKGILLVIEANPESNVKDLLLDGINSSQNDKSLYINLCNLIDDVQNNVYLKNYRSKRTEDFDKKVNSQLSNNLYSKMENPYDYLEYEDETTSDSKSPGYNSEQYLKIVLSNPNVTTIFIDQPEDNLGNQYISDDLVKQIRNIKFQKQLFLVTHNPSIVIYGDAENIILAENNDKKITYKQMVIEDKEAQESICKVLDGGRYIFTNRAKKYNIHRLNNEEQNNE